MTASWASSSCLSLLDLRPSPCGHTRPADPNITYTLLAGAAGAQVSPVAHVDTIEGDKQIPCREERKAPWSSSHDVRWPGSLEVKGARRALFACDLWRQGHLLW